MFRIEEHNAFSDYEPQSPILEPEPQATGSDFHNILQVFMFIVTMYLVCVRDALEKKICKDELHFHIMNSFP